MTPLGVLIRVTKQGVGYCSEVNDNVALPGTDTKESNSRIIRVRHVIRITKIIFPQSVTMLSWLPESQRSP